MTSRTTTDAARRTAALEYLHSLPERPNPELATPLLRSLERSAAALAQAQPSNPEHILPQTMARQSARIIANIFPDLAARAKKTSSQKPVSPDHQRPRTSLDTLTQHTKALIPIQSLLFQPHLVPPPPDSNDELVIRFPHALHLAHQSPSSRAIDHSICDLAFGSIAIRHVGDAPWAIWHTNSIKHLTLKKLSGKHCLTYRQYAETMLCHARSIYFEYGWHYTKNNIPVELVLQHLHNMPDITIQAWNHLLDLSPPGTLAALRKARQANLPSLTLISDPPCPNLLERRIQYARAHPVHFHHLLSKAQASRHDPKSILCMIDRNPSPDDLARDLGETTIVSHTTPSRRDPTSSPRLHAIQDLCSHPAAHLHSHKLLRNAWTPVRNNQSYLHVFNSSQPENLAAITVRRWNAIPRLLHEHRNDPARFLDRLLRTLRLMPSIAFNDIDMTQGFLDSSANDHDIPAILPLTTLIDIAAQGKHHDLPDDPDACADAISAWIHDCILPSVDATHAQALHALSVSTPGAPQSNYSLRATARSLVRAWILNATAPHHLRVPDAAMPPTFPLSIQPVDFKHWSRTWHRRIADPANQDILSGSEPPFPPLPPSVTLPPGSTHIQTRYQLNALADRQKHCVSTSYYASSIADGTMLCFSIRTTSESTLTLRISPDGDEPRPVQHRGNCNRTPPADHKRIAKQILAQIRKAWKEGQLDLTPWPRNDLSANSPSKAWKRIHRHCVPTAFHPIRPGSRPLRRLIRNATPVYAKALTHIRHAANSGIRLRDDPPR